MVLMPPPTSPCRPDIRRLITPRTLSTAGPSDASLPIRRSKAGSPRSFTQVMSFVTAGSRYLPTLIFTFSSWAAKIFCWLAAPLDVRAKSPAARAPSRCTIASVAAAFSWAVNSLADFLPVAASASCSTRAALMFGMTRWRESYSPRNAADIMSVTSAVGRLLKLPRSADNCTTSFDMPAACLPAKPSWLNMSPKLAADSSAACFDRPAERAALPAHFSIAEALRPKITWLFERVSFMSDAARTESEPNFTTAMPPAASATPATAPIFLSLVDSPPKPASACAVAPFSEEASPMNWTMIRRATSCHPRPSLG